MKAPSDAFPWAPMSAPVPFHSGSGTPEGGRRGHVAVGCPSLEARCRRGGHHRLASEPDRSLLRRPQKVPISRANREGHRDRSSLWAPSPAHLPFCLRAAGTPEGGRQGVAFHDHDPEAPSHGYEAAIGAPFGVPIARLAGRKGERTAGPFLWAPPTRRPPVTTLPPERVDRRTTERGPARCGPPATGGRARRD